MVDIDGWSRRVRSVSGLDEMHSAVRAFERNVSWAIQNEGRAKRAGRSRVQPYPLAFSWYPGLCMTLLLLTGSHPRAYFDNIWAVEYSISWCDGVKGCIAMP